MHSLFHCDFAQQAWKDAIFPNLFLCDCVNNCWGFLEYVISTLSSIELCLLMMIMWCIWEAQNNIMLGGQSSKLQNIMCTGSRILESFANIAITSVDCKYSSNRHEDL